MWAWREVNIALALAGVLCAAVWLGAWVVAAAVGLALAALLVYLLIVPDQLLAAWRRGRERHRTYRLQHRWPQSAIGLGWDVALGDGSRQVPELLQLRSPSPDVQVVELKPLSHQRRESWPVLADQLRWHVEAATCHWREVRPGVLEVTLGFRPLPTLVPFPAERAGEPRWDRLRLGVRAGGVEVAWCPADVPHLLTGGSTKGGKGGAIRCLGFEAVTSGWLVYVVNPKLSGEFRWLERLGVPVLETLAETVELLEAVELERARRQALIKAAGVGSWEQVPGWGSPPLLLMFDEVSALLMLDKSNKDVAKLQEKASHGVTRLVQLGRSAGIHLVLATQRPDISTLGPAGGILRDNLDARLGVCSLQDAGISMLFGSGLDPDIKGGLDGTKGRALATMLCAGDFDVYPLQLYWLDEAKLLRRPPLPLIRQGAGFDGSSLLVADSGGPAM